MTSTATGDKSTLPPSSQPGGDSATAHHNGGGKPKSDATKSKESAEAKRLSKTTAYLPFVYGSIAFYLGKKADEFQTHEWTLFIRGPNQEDLSVVISKVIFQLHASFAKPIRELTQPPFEVTERGWGEFEAQIRIIWKDPEEKPTVVNHLIKLYPAGAPPNVLPSSEKSEPVVAETYDEAVFTDPNETFYRQLTQIAVVPKIDFTHQAHVQQVFSDQEDFLALLEAKKFLEAELRNVKDRFQVVSDDLAVVDQALIKTQQQRQQTREMSSSSKKSKSSGSQRKSRPPSQNKKAKTS